MKLAQYPPPDPVEDLQSLYHPETLSRGLLIPRIAPNRPAPHGAVLSVPLPILPILDAFQGHQDADTLYKDLRTAGLLGTLHPITPDDGKVSYRKRWDLGDPSFRPKPVPLSWVFAFTHLNLWPPRDNVTIGLTPQYQAKPCDLRWYPPILAQDIIVSPGYGPNYRGARRTPLHQVVAGPRETTAWRLLAGTLPQCQAEAVPASVAVLTLQDNGFTLDESILLVGWLARKHLVGEAKRNNGGAIKARNGLVWVEFNSV